MTLPYGMLILHPTPCVSLDLSNSYAIALYPVVRLWVPPLHLVWWTSTARAVHRARTTTFFERHLHQARALEPETEAAHQSLARDLERLTQWGQLHLQNPGESTMLDVHFVNPVPVYFS
jgi:hypothetical protein